MSRRARSVRLWMLGLAVLMVVAYSSCGDEEVNLFREVARPLALDGSEAARLEEARRLIDQEKYDDAGEILEDLVAAEKTDSNEARLLYAAAKLGEAGFDVWSIISEILERSGERSGRSGGLDTIFNTFSDAVLGDGAERRRKVAALTVALEALLAAPEPGERKVSGAACLFAGLLAVPAITDATAAMLEVSAAVGRIRAAASGGGASCPNLSLLDAPLEASARTATTFNLILVASRNCTFLNVDDAEALMNQVEASLAHLRAGADRGCDAPSADVFPPCVQDLVGAGSGAAQAGDGVLSRCELVLNCADPTACFD